MEGQERPGARWVASLEFRDMDADEAATLEAFLDKLRGPAGRFYMHHQARPAIRGAELLVPVVNGNGQTGNYLAVRNLTPDLAGALLPGDMIGVGLELKRVVDPVTADATGSATVRIEPPLRQSPVDGDPVVLDKPTAIFMLTDDRQSVFDYQAELASASVNAIEYF